MNLILDTHILLWWYENPESIDKNALKLIEDRQNNVYVSAVSVWEISIKTALGKLMVPKKLFELIADDFLELPITWQDALETKNLKDIHQDPFDRLLIAQTISHKMTLVTRDKSIMKYDVSFITA